MSEELKHYGILRKSGRYPWGSGKDAYSRAMDFQGLVQEMKKSAPEAEVAKVLGMSVQDLRSNVTIAKDVIVKEQTDRATKLRFDKQMSVDAIAAELGIPAPTVRLRLKNREKLEQRTLLNTVDVIRKNVDEHQIVDVGKGTEYGLGVKSTKLKAALAVLKDEGYEIHNVPVKNVGTKHNTTTMVITPPKTTYGEAVKMRDNIHTMGEWTENDGRTYFGILPPLNVSSKRLQVVFDEDGGSDLDGVVYVRPGVKDLDMGKNTYAQVRIAVDGTHYIKGMAVLNHDMPNGVDMLFHTNKSRSVGKMGALKELTADPDNPFGSMIKRQIIDVDPKTGAERVKSAINIVNEEGDWDLWRKSLPSQMLAKQPHSLIKSQLEITRKQTEDRIKEIESITNPVIRKKALLDFADEIDSAAVELRAASMPRQQTQVIIPFPKMNKNEVYAPAFETGERLALIRYPHGGRFEIPEVTVNNNNRTAKKLLGNKTEAIGIHPSVAAKLSGADFDGDTVIAIPNRSRKIKGIDSLGTSAREYEKLSQFEPKKEYFNEPDKDGNYPYKIMKNTGLEMGMITNLITDMQVQGAAPDHIVRAVKHSMVVIDAEKHKLDYKRSEQENGIRQLKALYQGGEKSGASTLLSQATANKRAPKEKLRPQKDGGSIDPITGEKVYVPTGQKISKYDPKTKTYLDEKVLAEEDKPRLARTNDAYSLVRDRNDPVERLYADHANEMKSLANQTRLKSLRIKNPKINPEAKKVYKDDVEDLVRQLDDALAQAPLRRRADVIASTIVKAKRLDDPTLREDKERMAKVERQAKAAARARLNLKQPVIEITDRQWDAIQSGAVSSNRLGEILRFANPKRINELSMPKQNVVMTSSVSARARAMLAAGNSMADVAASLGVSVSTLKSAVSRGEV